MRPAILIALILFQVLCQFVDTSFTSEAHNAVSTSNASSHTGRVLRHYAVSPLSTAMTGDAPQLYSVNPQYPQYYFGSTTQDPCSLPQQVGTGPYRIPKWYFNPARGRCELFYWSGCCGNSNNFQTFHDCQLRCEARAAHKPNTVVFVPFTLTFTMKPGGQPAPRPLPTAPAMTCATPDCKPISMVSRVSGFTVPPTPPVVQSPIPSIEPPSPCSYTATVPAGQPIQCQPGSNVAQTCTGDQFCHAGATPQTTVCCPKSLNPCRVGVPFRLPSGILAYCSAADESVCPTGYYCHVGATAQTSVCCQALGSDPCGQPLDYGTGGAGLARWYWNAQAGCCQPFNYCGLRGTQNNFLTRQDCENMCMAINPCKLDAPLPLEQCIPGPNSCTSKPNMWCHVGATQETTVCCPAEVPNPCELPLDNGLGNDQLERWFYNSQKFMCEPFVYNGIKGNQNNFLTQQACEQMCFINPCAEGRPFVGVDGRPQTCSPSTTMNTCPADHWCHVGAIIPTTVCCPGGESASQHYETCLATPNPCMMPMSTGEGDSSLERFYFDQTTKTCKPFEYKGLKGNQNNFLTQRACQFACQPLDNPCIGQPATTPGGQVLFCSATNKDACPVNFWCHLGATPETTVCCPGATNQCSVPLSPGTGNSGLQRWYYNVDDRQCVPFQYNGKRGNQNNFLSQQECERTCPEQLCLLSIDRGACSGKQTRFAFNRQTNQCVPFEYSGCGGNLNNFLTMEDCVSTCGSIGF